VQAAVDASTHPNDVVKVAGYCAGVDSRSGVTQTVYLSKTLTIRGGYTTTNWTVSDPGANPTTLDALGQGRVFFIEGDISPTIERLRITGGNAIGLDDSVGGWECGGGVYACCGALTINDSQIFNNVAGLCGGGLYVEGNTLTLTGSVVKGNLADSGGGLCLNETASAGVLSDNVIDSNTAKGVGGGLYLRWSSPTLMNNIMADNFAPAGSGAFVVLSKPQMLHTTIARNGGGSGIYVATSSEPTFVNTILVGHNIGIFAEKSTSVTLDATLWGEGAWANNIDWFGDGVVKTGTVNIWGDPVFSNVSGGDYHIGFSSAATDRGVDAGVPRDIDGELRRGEPDLGADEYWDQGLYSVTYLPLILRSAPWQ